MTDRITYGLGVSGAVDSIVDPHTYQSDWGDGVVVENQGVAGIGVTGKILWEVVNPLNQDAFALTEYGEDVAFSWDTDQIGVIQSGLFLVEWAITWNTFVSDGSDHYTIRVDVPAAMSMRTELRFANSVLTPAAHFLAWLPVGSVRLQIDDGVDTDDSVVQAAFLRLAPMFTLDGIAEALT